MTQTQNIAVIAGDGIGPEVTAEALKVLKATVGEDAFDRRADLRIVLGPCLGVAAALEVTCHGRSLLLTRKP